MLPMLGLDAEYFVLAQVVAYAVKEIDWSTPAHPKISAKYVSVAPQQHDK